MGLSFSVYRVFLLSHSYNVGGLLQLNVGVVIRNLQHMKRRGDLQIPQQVACALIYNVVYPRRKTFEMIEKPPCQSNETFLLL